MNMTGVGSNIQPLKEYRQRIIEEAEQNYLELLMGVVWAAYVAAPQRTPLHRAR